MEESDESQTATTNSYEQSDQDNSDFNQNVTPNVVRSMRRMLKDVIKVFKMRW